MKIIFYIILLFFVPFIFTGIINRVKAIWGGRKGSPILQPLHDCIKLLKKGEVISKTTSFIFKITPSITVAGTIFAFLVLPIPGVGSVISFEGDFVLFSYILGFTKFLTVVSALDTGSSFEGMGASREVTFSTIVEPAFFILLGTLVLLTGNTSFQTIFLTLNRVPEYSILIKSLFTISLFIMLLTENSRMPVDDPNTHLELTMIHEVMVLDYSGPDLAYIFYGANLKMVLLSTLIANLFILPEMNFVVTTSIYIGIIFFIAIIIGLIESLIARTRMTHVSEFIFLMSALSLTAFAVVIFFLRGGF